MLPRAKWEHHVQLRGPCLVYNENSGITEACRRILGSAALSISKQNLLKLLLAES